MIVLQKNSIVAGSAISELLNFNRKITSGSFASWLRGKKRKGGKGVFIRCANK
jgi:hypothetical protein